MPTENDRGDAFEVFAEAYLVTQKSAQAKEVWPFDSTPLSVKQALTLDTGRDMGVDGVVETITGEYDAYQAKFRSGQRAAYEKGNLSEDRVKRIEDIGLVWHPFKARWEQMFAELMDFEKRNGHCDVPSIPTENPKLVNWVQAQRAAYRHGKLSWDRIRRLEEIGFVWHGKRGRRFHRPEPKSEAPEQGRSWREIDHEARRLEEPRRKQEPSPEVLERGDKANAMRALGLSWEQIARALECFPGQASHAANVWRKHTGVE